MQYAPNLTLFLYKPRKRRGGKHELGLLALATANVNNFSATNSLE